MDSVHNSTIAAVCEPNSMPPHLSTFLSFRYRVYPKQCAIQLKPLHDKTNHFSIIWTKDKKTLVKDFPVIEAEIREFIMARKCKLQFTILRACTNCTYGRFDADFENLILDLRKRYPAIHRVKDLTLGDPKHADLSAKMMEIGSVWDESHPIIHHIHGKSCTGDMIADSRWESTFRGPMSVDEIASGKLFGNTVMLDISIEEAIC